MMLEDIQDRADRLSKELGIKLRSGKLKAVGIAEVRAAIVQDYDHLPSEQEYRDVESRVLRRLINMAG